MHDGVEPRLALWLRGKTFVGAGLEWCRSGAMGVRFFAFMGLKGLRTMTIPNSVCRLLACVVLAILPGRPVGANVSGRARVVDGDSLVVSGQRIRFHGDRRRPVALWQHVGMRPHRPGGRARRASFGSFALFVVAALIARW